MLGIILFFGLNFYLWYDAHKQRRACLRSLTLWTLTEEAKWMFERKVSRLNRIIAISFIQIIIGNGILLYLNFHT